MYFAPAFVDAGLKKGQFWPSPEHRQVAGVIILGNPNVVKQETIEKVVQAILQVPKQRIKKISYKQLVSEFKMPDVSMPALLNKPITGFTHN